MTDIHKYLTYSFLIVVGVLALSSYLKNEENNQLLKKLQLNQESQVGQNSWVRNRRDANNDIVHGERGVGDLNNLVGSSLDDESIGYRGDELHLFLLKYVNKTFQTKIKGIVENLIDHLPAKKICHQCFHGSQSESFHSGKSQPPTQYEGDHCLGDYPPHLILSKLNHTVNKGENITFECTFFGNPLPQVEWESNGKDTKVTMCINKAASQITSRLHVRNVDWVNRGTVRCVASTRHGKASGSGMLNVYELPRIKLPYEVLTVPLGTNFQFPKCEVDSYPVSDILWRRFENELPGDRAFFTTNGVLSISRVQKEDEDIYECVAVNSLGESRKSVELKTQNLKFETKSAKVVVSGASVTTLTCSAYGNPDAMRGRFRQTDNTIIASTISKSENLFTISARVSSRNLYRCEIELGSMAIASETFVDMFQIHSDILNDHQLSVLGKMLKKSDAFGNYTMCWRFPNGPDGGDTIDDYHNLCGDKQNTITVIKTTGPTPSRIIGGYTEMPGLSETDEESNSRSFLFDFHTKKQIFPIRSENSDDAVCEDGDPTSGPCFGRTKELYVSCVAPQQHQLKYSITKDSLYNYNGPVVLNGDIAEIEVFFKE